MTGFIAMYNVAYEGSHLIGFFSSIEEIIEHIKNNNSLKNELKNVEINSDQAYLKIENAAASWWIEGKNDIFFTIYQVAHQGNQNV